MGLVDEKKHNNETKPTVLIADDDAPSRMLLRAAISQWGYEIVEAGNGEQALNILKESNPPRLLILDWIMPKMDGITLCDKIRHEFAAIPYFYIILLTQHGGATNATKGIEAGADEFLTKPFNMAELRSRLSVGERIVRFENKLAKLDSYISCVNVINKNILKIDDYIQQIESKKNALDEKIIKELKEEIEQVMNSIKKINRD
jgi:DNA-binding response OmpR family regulator